MRSAPKILLIFFLFLSTDILAQCPPNIGFEDGSFNQWRCFYGDVLPDGTIDVPHLGPISGRHTIIDKKTAGRDFYGHFPTSSPNGGRYSIRLGNSDTVHQAERVTYTYKIPPGQELTLTLNYAVVLQNPDHAYYEQPRFTAKIFDVTDNNKEIDCPKFDWIATTSGVGFIKSDVPGQDNADVYYKDWASTTINLVGYGGKQVRLEFTTNDCAKRRHFGYAYLDLNETCSGAITGNSYCNGQKEVTLIGPPGFDKYTWYKPGDLTKEVGTGPSLHVPAVDGAKYAVIIMPFFGVGCIDTLYTTINKVLLDFELKVAKTVYGCTNSGANLAALSVTAGSTPGLTLSYYTDSIATVYVNSPGSVGPGVYYIKGQNAQGCQDIARVQVVVFDPPVVTITQPRAVDFPTPVDISHTFIPETGITYSYYSDAAATAEINPIVKHGGTYYVKAVNKYGCITIQWVDVKINKPKYTLTAPNTFTPNNDGINDVFSINVSLDNVVTFKSIKVFNRNGQLVFTGKSFGEFWNGTYNGRALPTGTYYWVFEGVTIIIMNALPKHPILLL